MTITSNVYSFTFHSVTMYSDITEAYYTVVTRRYYNQDAIITTDISESDISERYSIVVIRVCHC